MEFFDSHSHYNDEKFDEDREEIIEQTYNDGITKFVCAGYNIPSSKFSLELAQKYNYIYSIVGISPNDIPQTEEELWKSIEEISSIAVENRNNKIVAIGEIGLDYYWNTENKDLQKQAFIKQIELANKLELPIVIHSRDAFIDTIDIIKNHKVNKTGVFHCCQQNQELVKQALQLGYYISFAGPITFKNSKNAPAIIDMVPLDKMLIETDSPYLSPEPHRGQRNDCRNVKYVAQKIADLKGISLEEIAKQSKSKQSKELCIKKKIDSFKETIEKETRKLEVMYDDRLAGIITLDEYMKNANRIKECVKGYEQSIKELEQELSGENDKTKSESRLDNLIEEFLNMEKPTKEIIREFIDKIEIHSDKQVDIYFNFKPLQELNNNFSVAKKEYEKKAV